MTLHLRPIPSQPKKRCDTRALLEARARVKAQLESDKMERRISAEIVDRHNRHIQQSRMFKQNGANDA